MDYDKIIEQWEKWIDNEINRLENEANTNPQLTNIGRVKLDGVVEGLELSRQNFIKRRYENGY